MDCDYLLAPPPDLDSFEHEHEQLHSFDIEEGNYHQDERHQSFLSSFFCYFVWGLLIVNTGLIGLRPEYSLFTFFVLMIEIILILLCIATTDKPWAISILWFLFVLLVGIAGLYFAKHVIYDLDYFTDVFSPPYSLPLLLCSCLPYTCAAVIIYLVYGVNAMLFHMYLGAVYIILIFWSVFNFDDLQMYFFFGILIFSIILIFVMFILILRNIISRAKGGWVLIAASLIYLLFSYPIPFLQILSNIPTYLRCTPSLHECPPPVLFVDPDLMPSNHLHHRYF